MKYKLINNQTGEEHICNKVVIDGWDYYVSDEIPNVGNPFYDKELNCVAWRTDNSLVHKNDVEIIATNNPSIDIPKVVDEDEKIALMAIRSSKKFASKSESDYTLGFIAGYKESQETHPFSEEDMIEFDKWKNEKYKLLHSEYVDTNDYYSIPDLKSVKKYTTKELFQLWKEQRPKKLYYE